MSYKNKMDKIFEYLKDNFFEDEVIDDFDNLNLNYNFESEKYLNKNFIFQNINRMFLQSKFSEIKNFEKKFYFLADDNVKKIFEDKFRNESINDFNDLKKLFSKKKNISKISLNSIINLISKNKLYNFFELNILENENFKNFKEYRKEKSILENEYSFFILNLKNNSSNLKFLLKEKQKNINLLNIKNQEILDENFKNLSNNFIKLNFLRKIKKSKVDIENMKIISQFPKYLNK